MLFARGFCEVFAHTSNSSHSLAGTLTLRSFCCVGFHGYNGYYYTLHKFFLNIKYKDNKATIYKYNIIVDIALLIFLLSCELCW